MAAGKYSGLLKLKLNEQKWVKHLHLAMHVVYLENLTEH